MFITYVPSSPSFAVSTPCCTAGGNGDPVSGGSRPACLGRAGRCPVDAGSSSSSSSSCCCAPAAPSQWQPSARVAAEGGRAQDSRCTPRPPQCQCPPQTPARHGSTGRSSVWALLCYTLLFLSGARYDRAPAAAARLEQRRQHCPRTPPAAPAGRPGSSLRPFGTRPRRARGTPWGRSQGAAGEPVSASRLRGLSCRPAQSDAAAAAAAARVQSTHWGAAPAVTALRCSRPPGVAVTPAWPWPCCHLHRFCRPATAMPELLLAPKSARLTRGRIAMPIFLGGRKSSASASGCLRRRPISAVALPRILKEVFCSWLASLVLSGGAAKNC